MSRNDPKLRINARRLVDSIGQFAEIGATSAGGVSRLALTDIDRRARDHFIQLCREQECSVRIDRVGNIFARARTSPNSAVLSVLTGSHLDSQPTGGKFDGALGVLAGLEIIRVLHENSCATTAPVEVVVWTNEEGARFAPSMMGSGIFTGRLDARRCLHTEDGQGVTFERALDEVGYHGNDPVSPADFSHFVELHIEQGPVLEQNGIEIGVVEKANGQDWFDIVLTGFESHAGTTPMSDRRDALAAAADIVLGVEAIAGDHGRDAVATVGELHNWPNARNTIPGQSSVSVDLRHPEKEMLDSMNQALLNLCEHVQSQRQVIVRREHLWHQEPVSFDPTVASTIRHACNKLRYANIPMTSGAGHDACHLASTVPTAMIFIPCKGGISHNELEFADFALIEAGANVLLHTVMDLARTIPHRTP